MNTKLASLLEAKGFTRNALSQSGIESSDLRAAKFKDGAWIRVYITDEIEIMTFSWNGILLSRIVTGVELDSTILAAIIDAQVKFLKKK